MTGIMYGVLAVAFVASMADHIVGMWPKQDINEGME